MTFLASPRFKHKAYFESKLSGVMNLEILLSSVSLLILINVHNTTLDSKETTSLFSADLLSLEFCHFAHNFALSM